MPQTIQRILGVRGEQRLGRLPIASGQTYLAGDFLTVNSSGQLVQAATVGDGTSTNGQVTIWSSGITNLIVGRAVEDAQPSANDPTIIPSTKKYGEFIVAEPGTQFEMPIWHATAASAYPNPNQLGTGFELWNINASAAWATGTNAPSNIYVVRLDKTTAVKCQLVGFIPDEYPNWPDVGQDSAPSSGTLSQYCRAWVEFLGGACYLSGARPITRTN